jgi:hypothetical protein
MSSKSNVFQSNPSLVSLGDHGAGAKKASDYDANELSGASHTYSSRNLHKQGYKPVPQKFSYYNSITSNLGSKKEVNNIFNGILPPLSAVAVNARLATIHVFLYTIHP